MGVREIKPNIYSVGALDWDRRLFDELIPLPDGTSYNSYLVRGTDKTALIDTVDPTKSHELIENLNNLSVKSLDYVITNHAEQDHSGTLPDVLAMYPMARVVTNARCKEMLIAHLNIPGDKFLCVGDNDILSIGQKTFRFIIAPWVHWPETMFTYLEEDGILFTCDFLGSHLATSDLVAVDEQKVLEEAKRYYAEIMMPFRQNFKKHLERVAELQPGIIAPSHGPIYDRPKFIIEAHREWASDNVKNEVIIPYVTMHGSTQIAVSHLTNALTARGVEVKPFNLTKTDLGALAMALVDAATIIIATPTVLVGPHPQVNYAVSLIAALRPKAKFYWIIASYGWGEGKVVQILETMLKGTNMEKCGVVSIKGIPKDDDLKAIDSMADGVAEKHQSL